MKFLSAHFRERSSPPEREKSILCETGCALPPRPLYIRERSGLGRLTSFEGASHTMHGRSLMRRAEPIFNGNIMKKSFVKMLLLSQKDRLPVRSWKRTLSALSEMGNSSRQHTSSIISIRKKLYAKLKLARLEAPTMCMRRATNE